MNHLDFAALEARAHEPHPWDHWLADAERLAGHDLDGDDEIEGYSLDGAHDAFERGESPAAYVASIRSRPMHAAPRLAGEFR
jgi:hypothetical protein